MSELQEFATQEVARIEEENEAKREELGFKTFYKMSEGNVVMTFADEKPRVNTIYAGRMIFRIAVEGEEFDYSVNQNSPQYGVILGYLKDGVNTLTITRVGTGPKDTRYVVRPA